VSPIQASESHRSTSYSDLLSRRDARVSGRMLLFPFSAPAKCTFPSFPCMTCLTCRCGSALRVETPLSGASPPLLIVVQFWIQGAVTMRYVFRSPGPCSSPFSLRGKLLTLCFTYFEPWRFPVHSCTSAFASRVSFSPFWSRLPDPLQLHPSSPILVARSASPCVPGVVNPSI